jgi:hypothetical protein
MNTVKSTFSQILRRKELLLFLIPIIAVIGLFGWLSGKMGLASFLSTSIPIPPGSAIFFIILCVFLLININLEQSRLPKSLVTSFHWWALKTH